MKRGKLTAVAARKLGVPELTGQVVQYEPGSHPGIASNIYYRGRKIGGLIDVGPSGVVPVRSSRPRRKKRGLLSRLFG